MSKVIINNEIDAPVELWDNDSLVGDIHYLDQIADVCRQVKEKKLTGHKIKAGNEWIPIGSDGSLDPEKVDSFFPNFKKNMQILR